MTPSVSSSPTSCTAPTGSTNTGVGLVADDLYARYMKAAAARRAHREDCTQCSPEVRCAAGQRLEADFVRLQDVYLARQKKKR